MNFTVGDTVIYPHHGAAVIEGKETRELKGEERDYFVLRLTYGDLTLMVPADSADEVGLREVVTEREAERVIGLMRERDFHMPTNWSRRFKANYEKLRNGDIHEVAEVVRNLSLREQEKGLSAAEKRMLTRARQVLVSELAAAIGRSDEETEALLDEALAA